MDKPPRRCFSEHVVSSRAKTSSLVPSHVATKIREAQLRQTNSNQLLLGNEKDKPTAFYLGTDRNLRSLNFSLKLPKTLPSWRITQIPTKQQVDGAETLPSIDTIIAEPSRVADKNRNMAETEFYEYTDNDGVVRRRSMMRTVNKDDCLTGRGANPRTGLITPDVCSVAGSIDSVIEPRQEVKLPSAQWKLKDNQWVSEIQDDENKEIDAGHQLPRISETNTQPLTLTNLRSFSHGVLGEHRKHTLQSPSTEAVLDVSKIRRKPIGSPSKVSSNSSEAYKQRSISEGTVIRTPPAVHSNPSSQQITSFFSPDDVERVRGLNGPRKLLRNQYDRLPFLDLPAKPYQSSNIQGFVKGKKNPMQLERSLRMNDGPYPFPPSTPQVNTDRSVTDQRAFLPAAPRAYFSGLTGQHSTRHPAQQRLPEQNRSLKQEKSATTSQNDLIEEQQSRHANWESRKRSLNTSTLNSMKPCYQRDTDQTRDDQLLWRQDTSLEDVHNIPNRRPHMPRALKRNHGDTGPTKSTARCRPPLGSRSNETNNPTMFRSKLTHTEKADRSNLTGTPVTLNGEDTIDRVGAGNTTNLPHPTGSTGTDTPVNLRNPTEQSWMDPEADLHDHSSCCPCCCVEYDCHEGCLGHSPQSEMDKSETSSLLSMGIFEASFETSIKAINDVLLTPEAKRASALTKLRQAFLESLWQNTKSPTRESTKQPPLKRTLRHPSPIRGSPIISGPLPMSTGSRHLNAKQAKAAARKAMDYDPDTVSQPPKGTRPAKVNFNPANSRKPSTAVGNVSVKNGANEGRKVSTATTTAISTQEEEVPDLEEEAEVLISRNANDFKDKSDAAESVIAKIGALVPYDRMSKPLLASQSTILKYGPALLLKSKDMVIVILDTLTILSCVVCDYKRTGYVTLPDDVNVSELMGNYLRSILYLMIAVCLYAFLVKVSRIVLCILRILLLPVRLCAWVIG